MDPKILELQKLIQLSGQNKLKQTGVMTDNPNDPTRQALANINKAHGFGQGIGESANTVDTQNYLNQYKSKLNPTDTATTLKDAITQQPQPAQDSITALKDAITQQVSQPITAPTPVQATNNAPLINGQYDSLVTALKAQIQQSINSKNQQIANKPQEYQPMKNENDVNRANNLRSALEQGVNLGDKGGNNRQDTININTNRDNVLNSLNQSQNNDINALKDNISSLVLEGSVQEATYKAQELKDLIANNQYVDSTNSQNNQNAFSNNISLANLTGNFNGGRTLAGQQYDQNAEQQDWTNNFSQQEFDYQKLKDTLDRTYETKKDAINNAFTNRQITIQERNAQLDQTKFNYDKQQDTLNRQAAAVKATTKTTTTKTSDTVKTYQTQIDKINSNSGLLPNEAKAQIASYIQNLEANGISSEVIDQLLILNGFSLGR